MDTLEARQREMRERNSVKKGKKDCSEPSPQIEDVQDVRALKKKIAVLEKRVLTLAAENGRLRAQKTIIVERTLQKSSGDAIREQQHNFFKYSNARRY